MTGAIVLAVEKGSNEAKAAARPAIFPSGSLLLLKEARFGGLGLVF